eukprot:8749996-Heterocapsa_arctica.AAC.1
MVRHHGEHHLLEHLRGPARRHGVHASPGTKLLKSQIRGAKSQAHSKGRSAIFQPAMASTRNGLNIGGVGVM